MRNIKKLFSVLLALTLVLSLGASALAVDITINDANGAGSEYRAYKLLNLTTTAEATEDSSGYAYTVNPTYSTKLQGVVKALLGEAAPEAVTDKDVIDYLNTHKEADDVRAFADAAFEAVKGMTPDYGPIKGKTFENVAQGYYLITETVAGDTENSAVSLVMLDTAGRQDVTVTSKEEVPKAQKKVQEKNDSTGSTSEWQDAADYDIGDAIPYQLKATMIGEHYADYETYTLQFVDTMSKGLTYDNGSTKVYYVVDGERKELGVVVPDIVPYAGENAAYAGGNVLTWDLGNIKALGVPAGAEVYIEYTATLNEGAAIGSAGNPNESHIVYSNNPYGEGTGYTPNDKVTVFTFDMDVNKIDGAGEALKGAGFTLLKKLPKGTSTDGALSSLSPEKNKDGSINAETYPKAGQMYTDGTNVYEIVEVIPAGETTKFEFNGLDSGEYLLVESVVPDGYNKAEDITIIVAAEYDTDKADPELTGLKVTPDAFTVNSTLNNGMITGDVTNLTGVELPETGGIGTTIFYVAGAVLVAAAVILLVTRRRMSGAQK